MKAIHRNRIRAISAAAGLIFAVGAAQAQTVATGSAPTAFSIEQTLTLTNILTTIVPNAPANILAAIAAGGVEVRERIIYNPTAATVTATLFTVAPGSPSPTPISTNITTTTLGSFVITVDRIYQSTSPTPAVMFTGTVTNTGGGPGLPAGILGNANGAPAAIALGYTTDTPAKLNNSVTLIAGQAVAYSAAATGTVTFPAAPVTPPGSTGTPVINLIGNTGQPIVIPAAGATLQVTQNPLYLDASTSTVSGGGTLTYQWSTPEGVNFLPSATSPAVSIYFPVRGDYHVTLTVTSNAGVKNSVTIPITFVGSSN